MCPDRYARWATGLKGHALVLVCVSWTLAVWGQSVPGAFDRFGQLRGMDFAQFYAAGRFVADGRAAELYDWQAFARALPEMVPSIGDLVYVPVYPPQVALLLAPLARFSYAGALAVWTACSALLYLLAAAVLLYKSPALWSHRTAVWAFALGSPAFVHLLLHGQITAPALLLLVGAYLGFASGRPWLTGLALGSLAFKPQFATFMLAAMLLCPSRALLAGALIAGAAQLALVLSAFGSSALADYADAMRLVMRHAEVFEPKSWALHSLRGAWDLLLGRGSLSTGVWIVSAGWAFLLARRAWDAIDDVRVRFGVLVVVAVLVNPHLYVYDLVLLTVPLFLFSAWLVERRTPGDLPLAWLIYALLWAPLLGPLAALTHVQLTSPAMIAILWLLSRRDKNFL